MAKRIRAINAYRPKIKQRSLVEMEEVVAFIARSTGINESGLRHVILELRDALLFFAANGHAVRLEGLGIYSPSIGLDGQVKLRYRPDPALNRRLHQRFHGEIVNKENVGKNTDELIALWNAEHPDDPVE